MNHDLVNGNFDLVVATAHRVAKKLPKWINLDDLISAGGEGLMQASRGFASDAGVRFRTYAKHRIRGAMWDWYRQHYGKRSSAFKRGISVVSWDQLEPGHDSPVVFKDDEWFKDPLYYKYDPATLAQRKDSWEYIKSKASDERGPKLIESYYGTAGNSMKEIGTKLDLSEARISQLHKDILVKYATLISMGVMNV